MANILTCDDVINSATYLNDVSYLSGTHKHKQQCIRFLNGPSLLRSGSLIINLPMHNLLHSLFGFDCTYMKYAQHWGCVCMHKDTHITIYIYILVYTHIHKHNIYAVFFLESNKQKTRCRMFHILLVTVAFS